MIYNKKIIDYNYINLYIIYIYLIFIEIKWKILKKI